ncbi:MAG: hypothetical protein EXX96DRAFT_632523 [Benjaminiella poitrasii]|nr:MAG: hypothetical protein EXX96DRAFT_632523 [Benjaminiella poitrasii]
MPLPLQFQILYNSETSVPGRMYPAFKAELYRIPIYRLIHHEFNRHYISVGQLFRACNFTLIEGLSSFGLRLSIDFQVDFLVSDFPFCDIWLTVEHAREIACHLSMDKELELLLSDSLSTLFTADNMNRHELMHNWIVPSIPSLHYSTSALLETEFEEVKLLIANQKIRTQVEPPTAEDSVMVMKSRSETSLLRWQVEAYEKFFCNNKNSIGMIRGNVIWDALQGAFFDLQASNDQITLSDSTVHVNHTELNKDTIEDNLMVQQLYIPMMLDKIMNELRLRKEWKQEREERDEEQYCHTIEDSVSANTNEEEILNQDTLYDRMDLIETELYQIKREMKRNFEQNQLKLAISPKKRTKYYWTLGFILCFIFGKLIFGHSFF